MTPVDFLGNMRKVVESGWTKGALARSENGFNVLITDPQACSFCLSGAYLYVKRRMLPAAEAQVAYTAFQAIKDRLGITEMGELIDWNDDRARTKEQVLELLDGAMAICK